VYIQFLPRTIVRMGSTTSVPVSQSRVVNTMTNPMICKYDNCKNRIEFRKTYCVIHDINTGQPKEEPKKEGCWGCCCDMMCM